MKRILFISALAILLVGCHSVPPKIQTALQGNLKTASEFDTLYSDLISCKTTEELKAFWDKQKCSDCKDGEEEKKHQTIKLGANVIRAEKLKKWAETGEE